MQIVRIVLIGSIFLIFAYSSGIDKSVLSYKRYLLQKNIIVPDDEIVKLIKQNEKLAELYRKKYSPPKELDDLVLDRFYANLYIKRYLEHYKIDDDVLKSYYLLHKDKFLRYDYVSYSLYEYDKEKEAKKDKEHKKFKHFKQAYRYDFVATKNLPKIIQENILFLQDGQVSNVTDCCGKYYLVQLNKRYKKQDLSYKDFIPMIRKILINQKYKEIISGMIK